MKEKIQKITEPLKPFFVKKVDLKKVFVRNFIAGIAWGIGASIGLSFILVFLTTLLSYLGGLPIIGGFFAEIIDWTNKALEIRKIR